MRGWGQGRAHLRGSSHPSAGNAAERANKQRMVERRHYVHDGRPYHDVNAEGSVADAIVPAQRQGHHDQIDRKRLLEDREYLLLAVCGKFQEVDTYHRGLITMGGFTKSLEALGLRSGQREVDDILQYCTVLDDSYVMYKDLLNVIAPHRHRAQRSSANLAIFPREPSDSHCSVPSEARAPPSHDRQSLQPLSFASRAEDVRRIYVRWERGVLSDTGFRQHLQDIGIETTREFDRLLKEFGPSRTMPFGKLMCALQAEENDGRRARNHHEVKPSDIEETSGGHAFSDAPLAVRGQQANSAASGDSANIPLRQAIIDFVDGRLSAIAFRQQLRQNGVQSFPQVERLIRTHESDNSVHFGDFARVLMRHLPAVDLSRAAAADAEAEAAESISNGRCTPSSSRACASNGYPPGGRGGSAAARPPPFAVGGEWLDCEAETSTACSRGPRSQMGSCQSAGPRSLGSGGGERCGTPSSPAQRSVASSSQPGSCANASLLSAAPWREPPPHEQQEQERQQQQQRSRPSSASRLQRDSGDILSWKGDQQDQRAPMPRRTPHGFLQGETPATPSSAAPNSSDGRPGKRFFSLGPPAGDSAPFGRASDVDGPSATSMGSTRSPFGTDVDYRLSRPEDAGTNEYRASEGVRRGGSLR